MKRRQRREMRQRVTQQGQGLLKAIGRGTDSIINAVAPTLAARRMHARMQIAAAETFIGASKSRRQAKSWTVSTGDQDEDYNLELPDLRVRSRDLENNNPIAKGAINNAVLYTVGDGPKLDSQIDRELLNIDDDAAEDWEAQTEREWRLFSNSKEMDLARTNAFAEACWQVYLNSLLSGDIFVLFTDKERPGSPYSLKLQFIEADLVSNPNWQEDGLTPKGAKGPVYGGVEKDPSTKEPIAYWIANNVSRRKKTTWKRRRAFTDSGRVSCLHIFKQKRPGGSRGVPFLAPVIEPLKQLGRYTEGELMAAVIAGMFTVFVKSETGKQLNPLATTEQADTGTDLGEEVQLGYGAIIEGLGKDDSIETANPGRPNANFDPFFMSIIKQIGMALGQPSEVLLKTYNSSYSAARAALIDAWRSFDQSRSFLTNNWIKYIYEEFMHEAVSRGRVNAPGFLDGDPLIRQAWLGASWVWPGRDNIRPDQEIKASNSAIELGIATRKEETAKRDGGNYQRKSRQRKREASIEKEIADLRGENEETNNGSN